MKNIPFILKKLSLAVLTCCGISMASGQVPVRIMPLGDSITAGVVTPTVTMGGYRERLYTLLTSPMEGYAVDFVGSEHYPAAAAEGWVDGDHEGHGAYKISDIRSEIPFWLKGIPDPDVILLHIGTNDFPVDENVTAAQDQLRNLLAELSAARPHAHIIVASLIPRYDSIEAVQVQFNQSLPGIVDAQVALGRKVSFLDMHAGFGSTPGDIGPDGVHPSTTGYEKMADVWLPAIKAVITPLGTNLPPAVSSANARADLEHVAVSFSKPINDADGINVGNFGLSDGVIISQATLDASKRVVTLTTGPQVAGKDYTLTVSGIRDRMVPENTIPAASTVRFTSRAFVDGSFEQADVAWVGQGSAAIENSGFYQASDEQKLVVFSGADTLNNGRFSQTIPTIANQEYRLQFDMGVYASNANAQLLQLTVRDGLDGGGGQILVSPAPQSMDGVGAPGFAATRWRILLFRFTATSGTTTISFEDVSTATADIDLLLDDVRLDAVINEAPVAVNDGGIGTPFLTVSSNSGLSPPIAVLNNDSDGDNDPLTISAATSPNGTVVINGGQTLGFIPATDFSGEATISYTISDGNGGTSVATAWVLVTAAGPFANGSFEDGSPVDFDAPSGWGVTGSVISYSSQGSYTAKPGNGTWMAIFNGGNNVGVSRISQSFVTTIGQAYTVAFDVGLAGGTGEKSQTLVASVSGDLTPPGQLTSWAVTSSTQAAAWAEPGKSFIFTATNEVTTLTFSVDLASGGLAAQDVDLMLDQVRVTPVNAPNEAPVAVGDSYATLVNVPLNVAIPGVLGNDTDDAPSALTAVVDSAPNQGGGLTLNADGSFIYTPALNYVGTESFTYHAYDGSLSSPVTTVSITINSAGLFANGSFEDGSPVNFGAPQSWSSTGVVTYFDTINYLPAAGNGAWMAVFNPGGDIPLVSTLSQTFATVAGREYTVAFDAGLAGGTGEKVQVLRADVAGEANPPGAPRTWQITSTGQLATWSESSFTFVAGGASATLTFTVDINASATSFDSDLLLDDVRVTPISGPEQPPVALNDGSTGVPFVTMVEDSGTTDPLAVLTNDSDPNLDALAVTLANSPNGTVVVNAGTTLSFTPAPNFSGLALISYTISDGHGGAASAMVYVEVTPVNDAPVAANDGSSELPFVNVAEESAALLPIMVLANDTDIELNPLTIISASSPNGLVVIDSETTLSFAPALNFNGATTISYTVSDGQGGTASATVFVMVTAVNDAPVAVDDGSVGSPLVTVAEDSGASAPLLVLGNDSDVDLDPLTVTAANSPDGVVVIDSGSTLSFEPALNFNGATTISYTVSDGQGGTASATVFVMATAVNDAPVAVDDGSVGSPLVTVNEDSGASAPLLVLGNDSDVDLDPLTVTAASSPDGVVVIDSGSTLSFEPALNFHGATTISYTVSDGQGGTSSATAFVAVTAVNDAPVAADDGSIGSPLVTVAEDSGASGPLLVLGNDSDVDLDPLTVTAASSLDGVVVIDSGSTLSFAPALNFHGATTISYTVSDGQGGTSSATAFVAVTAVNDAPVAVDDGSIGSPLVTVAEDSGASGPLLVLGNDSDVDLDPLTVTAASSPDGVVVIDSGSTLSFAPALNFHGATTISYTVSDGQGGTSSATAFVAVTAVNDAPVAVDDGSIGSPLVTVAEDSGASGPLLVLGNDSDVDLDPLTVTMASSPDGVVVINSGSTLSIAPALNFHGATTISYTVSDGQGGTASATAFVAVTAVNDAPVAVDDGSVGSPLVTVPEDSGASGPLLVLGNDSDVDLDPLTVTMASSPDGVVVINSGSTLSFAPALNFNGATTISYTVSDGQGGTASATAYVAVTAVNDAPVAVVGAASTNEDESVNIALVASDVDAGGSLTYEIVSAPAHGTVNISGAVATYNPGPDYNGSDAFTFIASDGSLDSEAVGISITVQPVNDAPVAADQLVAVNEDTTLSITLTGSDDEGAALVFAVVGGPSHGSMRLNGAVATYTPDPNFSGQDSFYFVALNFSGGPPVSALATVSITVSPVNDAPVAVPQIAVVNEDGSVEISLTGNDPDQGDVLSFTPGAVSNGALTQNGAVVTYTPDPNYNGSDSFVFTVSDGTVVSPPVMVAISILPLNDAPVAMADGSVETPFVTITEDSGVSAPIAVLANDSDVDSDPLTVTSASSPDGLVVINPDKTLAFTPTLNFNGTTSISYTISDGHGATATATAFITVNPVNDAPVSIAQSLVMNEDGSLAITLSGSDLDGDITAENLIYTVTTDPLHGALEVNGRNLVYTPGLHFNGADSITFKVNDGVVDSAEAVVLIMVSPVNDAPVAVNDGSLEVPLLAIVEDSGVFSPIPVLGNDSDVDLDPVTVISAGSSNGLAEVNPDGTLSFTPALSFNGTAVISYTISDGQGGTAVGLAFVTVTPVNDTPVANDDGVLGSPFATVTEDSSASAPIAVLVNDTDVDLDPLTLTSASSPDGSVTILAGLTLSFAPAPEFNGATTITYTISDGQGGTSGATVFVAVTPVNDTPVAIPGSANVNEDGLVAITLSGSDADPADDLTFAKVSDPAHGTVSVVEGVATYTPNADFNGSDSFTFQANDGEANSAPALVSITVAPVNDAPVAQGQVVSLNEDGSAAITLSGGDIDGDVSVEDLVYTVGVNPTNGMLEGSGRNLIYTPDANFNGNDSFSFTVSDGSLESPPAVVSISVSPVNDPPVALIASAAVNEDGAATITLAGADVDAADVLTFHKVSDPSNGTVAVVDGIATYIPNPNFNGADSFTFKVDDGAVDSEPAVVSITVNPVDDAPVAIAQAVSANEDVSLPITLTGSDVDGDALFFTVANPLHGAVSLSGAVATYTPAPNYNGLDTINFFVYAIVAGNPVFSTSAAISITVNPVNDAPVAFAQAVSVDEGSSVNITLTGGDNDGNGLTFAVGTAAHGTLSLEGAVATYTPAVNFSGADSFTFTVSDGSAVSTPATVSITVIDVAPDGFDDWLARYSLVADPGTDSDQDSISNAVEYVIDGNPVSQSDSSLLPTAELASADLDGLPGEEDYLVFTHRRTDEAKNDPSTTIRVEWSASLVGPWAGTSGMVEQVTDGAEVDLVKVYIPRSLAVDGKLFARLSVVIATPPAAE